MHDNPRAFTFEWRQGMDAAIADRDEGRGLTENVMRMLVWAWATPAKFE